MIARYPHQRGLSAVLMAVAALGLVATGCQPPPPRNVGIRLVNAGGLRVEANLYVSSAVLGAPELFVPANLNTSWKGSRVFPDLEPGESVSLSLECDQAATIGVDRPIFISPVDPLGNHRSSDVVVWHRPENFDCGNTVVFTYSADVIAGTYRVTASLE